jgi:hypothetical protein
MVNTDPHAAELGIADIQKCGPGDFAFLFYDNRFKMWIVAAQM